VKHIYILTISAILLISFSSTKAQHSLSIHFTTAIPTGDFRNFDNAEGFGGNIEFFFISPSQKKPFGMGISLSYFAQGLFFFEDPYTGESVLSNNRANNFINTHIVFQIEPPSGHIKPYFETLFGGSYIFSYSEMLTPDYVPVDLYIDDWAWSYGIGTGIKILVSEDDGYGQGSVFIDLKARYLRGTEVSYLDRNSIRYANDSFYYTLNKSNTEMFTLQLGAVVYF